MKIIAVVDEDANLLFQMLGIDTVMINADNLDSFRSEFDKLLQIHDLGVIIMNEQYLIRFKEYFRDIKSRKFPLIVEVPNFSKTLSQEYFETFIRNMLNLEFLPKGVE